jgi:hypothetical protein
VGLVEEPVPNTSMGKVSVSVVGGGELLPDPPLELPPVGEPVLVPPLLEEEPPPLLEPALPELAPLAPEPALPLPELAAPPPSVPLELEFEVAPPDAEEVSVPLLPQATSCAEMSTANASIIGRGVESI